MSYKILPQDFQLHNFLNFFFKFFAIFLFLDEIIIFLKFILDVQIPVITDDAILPVPIKPKFINFDYFILIILN